MSPTTIESVRAVVNDLYVGDRLRAFGAPFDAQVVLTDDRRIAMWREGLPDTLIFEPMPSGVGDYRAFAESLDNLIQSMARRLGEAMGAYPMTSADNEMDYFA